MERPAHIPEGAVYIEHNKQWQLGDKNGDGQKIGLWKTWHEQGHLWLSIDYGNGDPLFRFQRFHPDGTVAEEADMNAGEKFLGTVRHIKSDHPTIELFPQGGAKFANLWIAEFDYIEEDIFNAQRYFDRHNNPVNSAGEPLRERPVAVPERAHCVRTPFQDTIWVVLTVDMRIRNLIGEYYEWETGGAPVVKKLYSAAGELMEQHDYKEGKLSYSKIYDKDGLISSQYHFDLDPPVVRKRCVSKNNQKDEEETFFDETGRQLYSIRKEEVAEFHHRRYYNGKLVCEGIFTSEWDKGPVSAIYYSPDGATLIDCTSNGDGAILWRLYDTAGQELKHIQIKEEKAKYKLIKWDAFMTSWALYDEKTTETDWEAIMVNFEAIHKKMITEQRQQALEVPALLQAELEKINWETIDTSTRNSKILPAAINGMLCEDEAIADMSSNQIWIAIKCEPTIYESAYKVTGILACMLPLYSHLPAVQLRLRDFLFGVLKLSHIQDDDKLYREMKTAIEPILPLFIQWASGSDAKLASEAQYFLAQLY